MAVVPYQAICGHLLLVCPNANFSIVPSPVTLAGKGNGSGNTEASPGFEPFS